MQTKALLDPNAEKDSVVSKKHVDKLRDELNDAKSLFESMDGIIDGLLPEYESAREEAIYHLKIRAKKDHIIIAKKIYSTLLQLSELQLKDEEIRYSLVSATSDWASSLSLTNLYNHNAMSHVGDEKVQASPFYNWIKVLKNTGYNL